MDDVEAEAARARLAVPGVSVGELWQIAQRFPELRVLVAAHPGADAQLVGWLGSLGDPAVDAVLTARGPAVPVLVGASGGVPVAATDGVSVAALVTGVLGLGPVPVVLGIVGLRRTRERGLRGRGMAVAGVVLGSLVVAAGVLVAVSLVVSGVLFWRAGTSASAVGGSSVPVRSFVLTPAGRVPAGELAAAADVVTSRLGGVPSRVSVSGSSVRVLFDSAPTADVVQRVVAPPVVQFRPVLMVGAPGRGSSSAPVAPSAAAGPSSPSDVGFYVSVPVLAAFDALDCSGSPVPAPGPADQALVACARDGSAKYVLGPVEIGGDHVSRVATENRGGQWVVNVALDSQGTSSLAAVSTRLQGQVAPLNQFAVVSDGLVEFAPRVMSPLTDGQLQVSGSYGEKSASALAVRLGFGRGDLAWKVAPPVG